MPHASIAHSGIVVNLVSRLFHAVGTQCRPLPSEMRVRVPGGERFAYPDVTIVCGPLESEDDDTLLNPRTIIEVVSASTERFDRGKKFAGYRSMLSVQEIVFVSETERRVEVYTRNGDHEWQYADHQRDDAVPLPELAPSLTLAQIYDRVSLTPI